MVGVIFVWIYHFDHFDISGVLYLDNVILLDYKVLYNKRETTNMKQSIFNQLFESAPIESYVLEYFDKAGILCMSAYGFNFMQFVENLEHAVSLVDEGSLNSYCAKIVVKDNTGQQVYAYARKE